MQALTHISFFCWEPHSSKIFSLRRGACPQPLPVSVKHMALSSHVLSLLHFCFSVLTDSWVLKNSFIPFDTFSQSPPIPVAEDKTVSVWETLSLLFISPIPFFPGLSHYYPVSFLKHSRRVNFQCTPCAMFLPQRPSVIWKGLCLFWDISISALFSPQSLVPPPPESFPLSACNFPFAL